MIEPPAQKIPNNQAAFSGLDKITGRIISFDVAINETVQFGALQVTPRVCYTRPPTETPNTDAFIEVDEITLQGEIKRLFTGWMFAASPGLHAVEHPIYDVWLADCKGPQAPTVAEVTPAQPPPAQRPPQQRAKQPAQPKARAAADSCRRRSTARRSSRRGCRRRRSRSSGSVYRAHDLVRKPLHTFRDHRRQAAARRRRKARPQRRARRLRPSGRRRARGDSARGASRVAPNSFR